MKSKKHICKFEGHENNVICFLIGQDNKTGFSASIDAILKVWNLENKEIRLTLKYSYPLSFISLIDRDKTIVAAGQGFLTFCDLKSKIQSKLKTDYKEFIYSMQFEKSEEHFILCYKDGNLQIFKTQSLKKVFESKKHSD